jgi:quinol monooxygenase YgiN
MWWRAIRLMLTGFWVTEVWDSQASHQASLNLPAVQQAIARGRPMIAGFAERFVTEPVGGVGLARSG